MLIQVAPLLLSASDPALPEKTRSHLSRAGGQAAARAEWRTFHPIEFAALNNHTWFGHLIDDVVSNTYRALRFVGDADYGDLLYAEFTAQSDWHWETPVHYELFNMTTDPHQLTNLYASAPAALRSRLQARLVQQWGCAGPTCP